MCGANKIFSLKSYRHLFGQLLHAPEPGESLFAFQEYSFAEYHNQKIKHSSLSDEKIKEYPQSRNNEIFILLLFSLSSIISINFPLYVMPKKAIRLFMGVPGQTCLTDMQTDVINDHYEKIIVHLLHIFLSRSGHCRCHHSHNNNC